MVIAQIHPQTALLAFNNRSVRTHSFLYFARVTDYYYYARTHATLVFNVTLIVYTLCYYSVYTGFTSTNYYNVNYTADGLDT